MINRYMKMFPAPFVIKEIKIKTIYHYMPNKISQLTCLTISSIEQLKFSYTVDCECKLVPITLENCLAVCTEAGHLHTI